MADSSYTVERSIDIHASPVHIYDEVSDFHQWPRWSPWEDVDPAMKRTYAGAQTGTGSIYHWSGNRKAGQGTMEILESVEPSRVRIGLQFEKPFKARNEIIFTIRPAVAGAHVTWTMTGQKTLMTKVMGLFTSMDKMIGPDFEKGLARLKATTESTPAT
ncbi:MAG TPA: SRPBCC family protein [Propionibacteriaceae bacterium]|nr:SRPBCC family protein [Propionibacteriaceae bacterium]